ncbi:hypothetical protein [Bacteroides sp. 224]|uniref:hypothetical protein n=1 Tax=Bacteroides sp. 224 TaxID=2302936 RepID=UPI0013D377C8|nr:hypothetical protein [Bacteroides sp. 224]NDV63782.1 hypothetical protein [Bacteroides sp. 224]
MKKKEYKNTVFVFETIDGQELSVQKTTPTVNNIPVESEIVFLAKDDGCEAIVSISLNEAKNLIQALSELIDDAYSADSQTTFKSIIN